VILALGQSIPDAIAVDAQSVYWNACPDSSKTTGKISKVSINAGGPLATVTTLANGLSCAQRMALGEASVFFTTYAANQNVASVPINGGAVFPIATGAGRYPRGVAVDSAFVYWADNVELQRAPIGGGSPLPLAQVAGGGTASAPSWIALDSANVYWTQSSDIEKTPKSGGATTPLVSGQSTGGLVVYGGRVYWIRSDSVMSTAADGSSTQTITDAAQPNSLAVDSSGVYWTAGGGLILMCGLNGGRPTVLASGQTGTVPIVTDSNAIYWSTADGTVMKLAKP